LIGEVQAPNQDGTDSGNDENSTRSPQASAFWVQGEILDDLLLLDLLVFRVSLRKAQLGHQTSNIIR
jgi:hypothetical protein